MSAVPQVKVSTNKASWSPSTLNSKFTYESSTVTRDLATNSFNVTSTAIDYEFKTDLKVGKTGLLLVGLGGNNGSTTLAAILANKHQLSFETKEGTVNPNYYGSVTQSSTVKIGVDPEVGNDVYAPFKSLVPMVNPNDLVIGGWDINSANLKDAMKRAKVLDINLQEKLAPYMEHVKPLASVYYPDFIALNQEARADNVANVDANGKVNTNDKWNDVERIRNDIQQFKKQNNLDKVIVLWTANTERYCDVIPGVHDTAENFLAAVKSNHSEISPSSVFATACILDNIPYINGSPQNTFVPGVVELAEKHGSFIGGDDFKTGQTKIKSVLAQYLVEAGIKPISIASYNHLGNNDGYNLSSPKQFRSKEISKQSVVDDVVQSNEILYNTSSGRDKVDHCIVIKYLPAVGDSKVAMDEYYSELMLGGHNKIAIHNTCEDSLLAVPLILDLAIVCELLTRVQYKRAGTGEFKTFYSVLSFLSYWLKAPMTKPGFDPINGLNKQRAAIENLIKILVGLPLGNDLRFEERLVI
ncbi:inositol-3-phosphate synthase [Saccharomycopsis crataegensis]|uniref:Inositol-3-phosphate synthase n=1 Tax=Saccharomycopsis crataegensis TaxID=43959 RepID=A0AAV5QIA6_9ASCO|nr:inositol-3-phosphate synthase [Saccharomycopsis crataegensis]